MNREMFGRELDSLSSYRVSSVTSNFTSKKLQVTKHFTLFHSFDEKSQHISGPKNVRVELNLGNPISSSPKVLHLPGFKQGHPGPFLPPWIQWLVGSCPGICYIDLSALRTDQSSGLGGLGRGLVEQLSDLLNYRDANPVPLDSVAGSLTFEPPQQLLTPTGFPDDK